MTSDEKEEMFDEWEDDDGFPSADVDSDGFPEETGDSGFEDTAPQQQIPVKKKRGGGVLLFLLILLGGAGGGFYFLTTPGGAPYRDYLPEAVRGFLPAAESPKPKTASAPAEQQVADVLDGDVKTGEAPASDAIDPLGFQAPPMPSLSADKDTATADDSIGNVEGFTSFGGTEDAGDDAAWGSNTPSEDDVTVLSFDSVADSEVSDTETIAADEIPAPLAMNVAGDKTEIADSQTGHVTGSTEKQPEGDLSSFSAAANQAPAVKTEQLIDLEDRMSVLEKAVSGLEKTVVTKKDLSALQGDVSSLQADIRALRGELKKAASAPRNVAPASKEPSSSSVASTATAKPAATAKPTPPREWVMVSAQPGTAWISEKGSTGKREVSVGDTVPGLGRITSIAPNDNTGRWVVKGTRGTLHQ